MRIDMTASLQQRTTGREHHTQLSQVAWIADDALTYEDWLRAGCQLGTLGRTSGWWIGDWIRFGTAHYGAKYTAAARITGYDPQTLMNMVYVATRFEISRRREKLSWSHHSELAALEVAEQEAWLDRAVKERLSVRDLRELLSTREAHRHRNAGTDKRLESTPSGADTPETMHVRDSGSADVQRIIVCPHCGSRFIDAKALPGKVPPEPGSPPRRDAPARHPGTR